MADSTVPDPGLKRIAHLAAPIARRHGVEELYLFGSMARNEGREDSDVDFIYQMSPKQTNSTSSLRDLRYELREALGREIDLTRKSYVTDEIPSDPLAELQRRAFVRNLTRHPMYRIV